MRLVAAGLALSAAGCFAAPQSPIAVGGGTVLQATRDPLAYRPAQPRDAGDPPWSDASGEACRTLVIWPFDPPTPFLGSSYVAGYIPWPALGVTMGDDGLRAAVTRARDQAGGRALFDVRVDLHTTAVLGIFRRECVEIHALLMR